jgi:hypothetical protein
LDRTRRVEVTPDTSHATADPFVGPWLLLFPATFLVHIAEEYWGGIPARASELAGIEVSEAAFLGANTLFWVLMTAAVVLVLRRPSWVLLVVSLATIIVINVVLHIGGALLTVSYSPGLVSGVVLWLPLGIVALARGRGAISGPSFRSGVLIGVVAHILVPLVGVGFILMLGGGCRAA